LSLPVRASFLAIIQRGEAADEPKLPGARPGGRELERVDAGLHCGNAPFATYVGMMIPALPNVHATV